jgi:hypothetical protein
MELMVLGTLSSLSLASNITEKLLTNTIQNSFGLIKNFVSFHHEQINEVLSEHDLISKLEIIQALMRDIENENETKENTSEHKPPMRQSVQKALSNLHLVVEEIVRLLENIDNKIKYHSTKYLSGWRRLNYEDEVKRLKKSIKLMDMRYEMFLEVLKVR